MHAPVVKTLSSVCKLPQVYSRLAASCASYWDITVTSSPDFSNLTTIIGLHNKASLRFLTCRTVLTHLRGRLAFVSGLMGSSGGCGRPTMTHSNGRNTPIPTGSGCICEVFERESEALPSQCLNHKARLGSRVNRNLSYIFFFFSLSLSKPATSQNSSLNILNWKEIIR